MTKVFTYNFPTNTQKPVATTLSPYTLAAQTAIGNMTQYTSNSALTQAFGMWSTVIDVRYQAGVAASGQISFANWNNPSNGSATTLGVTNGDFNTATNFWIFLNTRNGAIVTSPTVQNWGVYNLAHEIGHTLLGSGHPSLGTDDLRMSIMSYPTSTATPISAGGTIQVPNPTVKIPLTPGMADITALQTLRAADGQLVYGTSQTSSGNDSYVFTQATIGTVTTGTVKLGTLGSVINIDPAKAVMTIYDSNGIDTINAAGVNSSVFIDLNAGQFSSIGANKNIAPGGAIGGAFYGTEYNVGIANGANIENATGGSQADYINGNALSNVIIGGGGNDTVFGGGGNDTITGDAGNDNLDGFAGNDTLSGGIGNDTLAGSVGSDAMTGGTGADAFVFNFFGFNNITGIDTDRITDFSRTEGDKIDLSFIDANINTPKNVTDEAFSFYANGSFVQGDAGRLISQAGTNGGVAGTMVSADVDGNTVADFNIFLVGIVASTMLASDFIL